MAYPVVADIVAYLEGEGFELDASQMASLGGILSGVIAQWEKDSGWMYFVSSGAGVVHRYSCNGDAILPLDCGIITLASVVVDGVTLTENTDFELWPYNRSPKKEIRFRTIPWCDPRGIVVTATWGYAATCPADVFLEIQKACGAELMERTRVSSSVEEGGDAASLKQGPVTIEFDSSSGSGKNSNRPPSFMSAINRYRFRTL